MAVQQRVPHFEQKVQALEDGDADTIEKAIRDKYDDTKADHSVGGDIAEATGKTVEAMASESVVSQNIRAGPRMTTTQYPTL